MAMDQGRVSPRPYLSWSQIQLFERNPEWFAKKYLSGEEEPVSEATRFGKRLATALELQQSTGDDALDRVVGLFPGYPQREFKLEAWLDGVEVPLYGILDGFDEENLRIGEYKSGRLWDQQMVDESGQLKMYELMVWLKYQALPSEVMLHWAGTQLNADGALEFTGEVVSFKTEAKIEDLDQFASRVRAAWKGIKDLYQEHRERKSQD